MNSFLEYSEEPSCNWKNTLLKRLNLGSTNPYLWRKTIKTKTNKAKNKAKIYILLEPLLKHGCHRIPSSTQVRIGYSYPIKEEKVMIS
jgi:hypothetical protein